MAPKTKRPILRTLLRGSLRLAGAALLLGVLGLILWLRGALYRHWVTFPREAAAWAAVRADHRPVPPATDWKEYRGVLHSHSELSHDCEVPFDEILAVLKSTGRDFICLSDHAAEGRADFGTQWRGLRDGKLFIPGFEMKQGLMPFGVRSDVVLSNSTPPEVLARQIVDGGGLLFYAHPEEPRDWDRPELTGMEIYNLHADFKDEGHGLLPLLPDLLVNQRRYPDQVFRRLFDRPTLNLKRWDELNRTRRIVGIGGNDCHQNTGFRGFSTPEGALRIEDTSPETLAEYPLNWFTRAVVRLCFGPLEPGRKLFQVQLDPYERMVRFVSTHVLAHELSEPAILESLRAGRAFVGFDRLADSSGFTWIAEGPQGKAVMGEEVVAGPGTRLRALSPQACRFTVVKDGTPVHAEEGRELTWTPSSPGQYRVEAELKIRDAWTPWVYVNPIRITLAPASAVSHTPTSLTLSQTRPDR